jgi:tetratricopeptide (TPR) repeat protein
MAKIITLPTSLRRFGLALLCVLPLLAACGRGPRVSIPLQENPGKQYAYALNFRDQSNMALITNERRYRKVRSIVREHYQKVIDFFPGDRKATPLAELEVIEMDAGLDSARVKVSSHDLRNSIKQLQDLAAKYPEYDFIQAKALYDQGLCFRLLRDFPQAQACFRQVNEKYLKNASKEIRDLAIQAGTYYNRTYVNE